MTYSGLGYDPAAFEPVSASFPAARSWLAAQLREVDGLSEWHHYAEPPEQLAGGACVIIAPRSPYWSWETYRSVTAHLTVHLLVPRMHGPAMDLIDTGLAYVRDALISMPDADIGPVASVGILDDVGEASYIVASIDVDLGSDLT